MSLLDNLKHAIKDSVSTRKDFGHALGKKKEEVAKKMSKKPRLLTEAERKEKTKNWPSNNSHERKESPVEYQNRVGRAYND